MHVASDRDAAAAPEHTVRPDLNVIAHRDEAVGKVAIDARAVIEEYVFADFHAMRAANDYAVGIAHGRKAPAFDFVHHAVVDRAPQSRRQCEQSFNEKHGCMKPPGALPDMNQAFDGFVPASSLWALWQPLGLS